MSKQDRKDRYFGDGARLDGTHAGTCPDGRLLPDGIERLTEEALCAERLMPEGGARLGDASSGKVKVAAFDFDGTCLNGSSPKKLVTTLSRKKLLSPYNVFRAGLWGLAYKLNLPKDPEGVRQRVFSAFEGCAASNVNDFLCRFYHERIAQLYRPDADASMVAHLEAGHAVVLISASFEPIIASAMVAAHGGSREDRRAEEVPRRVLRRGEVGAGLGLWRPLFRPRPAQRRRAPVRGHPRREAEAPCRGMRMGRPRLELTRLPYGIATQPL